MSARGMLVVGCLVGLVATLGAQPFHLDPGFGDGGRLVDSSAGFDVARAILVQPDGKVLVGGSSGSPQSGFGIARYLSNGDPDPSFTPPSIPIMQGFRGMALQDDGKIVAVGYTGANFGIVRLLEGGSPDPAFDGDGHDSVDFLGGIDFATAVAIQPDDKIVVAGFARVDSNTIVPAVARYLTNGLLDPAFGTGGKAMGPPIVERGGFDGFTYRVLIDSLGRIVTGEITGRTGEAVPGPIRFLSNGDLDASFGTAGSIELPADFLGVSMALAPDDGILIVGRESSGGAGENQMWLLRFASTGLPDAAFGGDGQQRLGSPAFYPEGRAAVFLADGRFYLAAEWSQFFFLGRFLADGSSDTTFAPEGYVLTPFPMGASIPYDLTVQTDGAVVVAGLTGASVGFDAALARYAACGLATLPPPTIASIAPAEISALGSSGVEITGTGLDPSVSVRIGQTAGWGVDFTNPGSVFLVVVPSHDMGLVDVVVENPDCQTATLVDGLFLHPQDVPPGNSYYPFVRKLIVNEVTAGCSPIFYCGSHQVTRAQMAVFLLRSKEGPAYEPPPATGTVFADVPIDGFAAAWIEELSHRNITAGCDVNLYCPDQFNTRAQMAVFLLVTLEGTVYQPPDPQGLFADVPVSSPYARWIEELFVRGITVGCAQGLYCPNDAVLREQMAVFLSITFSLPG